MTTSPTLETKVHDFLAQKRIAVAGVSRTHSRHPVGNLIYQRLKKTGHDVFPVNPHMQTFEGERCYPDLKSNAGKFRTVGELSAACREGGETDGPFCEQSFTFPDRVRGTVVASAAGESFVEDRMPQSLAEYLFLASLFVPAAGILAGALYLLIPARQERHETSAHTRQARVHG